MKKSGSITLLGCFFCSFILAFFSFQATALPAASTYFDTVQKFYIGYYQRPADPVGLIYWAGRLDAAGGNFNEMIEAFATSAESQALYGTITSSNISTVVNNIYLALLNRDADSPGLNYYVNGFNTGEYTAATIMLNVLFGVQAGVDLDTFNNKFAAANLFTRTIDPELDGSNLQVTYAGDGDVIAARNFLALVTSDPLTAQTQAGTTAYIQTNIADPGDLILVGTSATGTVSTNTAAVSTIATDSGAKITVPVGAVPQTASGGNGTIAFSIEKEMTTTPQLPTGVTRSSDVYRFGPGDTTFAKPVAVTLPLTTLYSPEREYNLYRVNPTTGVSEPYGADYDATSNTLTAQTYAFSPWYIGDRPAVNTAYGCVDVDNSASSIWRSVVTHQYTLKYPAADTNFNGASSTWSNGAIGWTNHGNWYLPQGSYQMCVEGTTDGVTSHSDLIPVEINSPWRYDNPICTSLGIGGVLLNQSGRCSMSPVPTPSVGTGDLQISLTWHSSTAIDLDLYVVEPNGEEISYFNDESTSGGRLDRDNYCGNYINGQSENIFWTNPPLGQYTIKVHLYSNCSLGTTSMPFEVRVVNKGVTETFSGTATLSGDTPVVFRSITVN